MAVRFSKVKGTPYQVAPLKACFPSFLLNKKKGGGLWGGGEHSTGKECVIGTVLIPYSKECGIKLVML